jgi:hypothetical protein
MKTRRGAIYRLESIKRRRLWLTAQGPKIQVLDGDRPTRERRRASPAAQLARARQAPSRLLPAVAAADVKRGCTGRQPGAG